MNKENGDDIKFHLKAKKEEEKSFIKSDSQVSKRFVMVVERGRIEAGGGGGDGGDGDGSPCGGGGHRDRPRRHEDGAGGQWAGWGRIVARL